MNDYREVKFTITPAGEDAADLLSAFLADAGYESFVTEPWGLTAWIPAADYDPRAVDEIIGGFPMQAVITYADTLVEGRDWNSEWEQHYYKPIVVGEQCVIHSSFHRDVPSARYDITIDPKMAFGTGHHATTSQVIRALLDIDLEGASVIDMGTGTAILAILSAMRGASPVVGVEIDPVACENAVENVALNGVGDKVKIVLGDAAELASLPAADVLVANILRPVIIADMARYATALKPGGTMILSGFYQDDIPAVLEAARLYGLEELRHTVSDRWACLICNKLSTQQ